MNKARGKASPARYGSNCVFIRSQHNGVTNHYNIFSNSKTLFGTLLVGERNFQDDVAISCSECTLEPQF